MTAVNAVSFCDVSVCTCATVNVSCKQGLLAESSASCCKWRVDCYAGLSVLKQSVVCCCVLLSVCWSGSCHCRGQRRLPVGRNVACVMCNLSCCCVSRSYGGQHAASLIEQILLQAAKHD